MPGICGFVEAELGSEPGTRVRAMLGQGFRPEVARGLLGAFKQAIDAGAHVVEAPAEMPWGDRRATVSDRWENLWQIATYRDTASVSQEPAAGRRGTKS